MRKNNTIKKWFVNWKKKQVEKNDSFIVQSLAAKNSNVISFNIFDHCGPNEVFDDLKLSGRPSKVEILQNIRQRLAESFKTFWSTFFQKLCQFHWNFGRNMKKRVEAKIALRLECLTKNLDLELILVCIVLIYSLKLGPNFLLDKIIIRNTVTTHRV